MDIFARNGQLPSRLYDHVNRQEDGKRIIAEGNMVNRVREIRLEKGMTLHELADRVGTTPTQISRLEKGIRPLKDQWMQKIATALEVSPGDLLTKTQRDQAIKLLTPKDTAAPYTDQLYFLHACFEFVCRERDRLSKRGQDFVTPRLCMHIAASVSRSFYDFFLSLGRANELQATIRFYILRHFVNAAREDGLDQIANEAEKLRAQEFARLEPDNPIAPPEQA